MTQDIAVQIGREALYVVMLVAAPMLGLGLIVGVVVSIFQATTPLLAETTTPGLRLVEAGEPVLLGGWHREVYRIWNEALADLNPLMFTGSESQPAKARAKRASGERLSPGTGASVGEGSA